MRPDHILRILERPVFIITAPPKSIILYRLRQPRLPRWLCLAITEALKHTSTCGSRDTQPKPAKVTSKVSPRLLSCVTVSTYVDLESLPRFDSLLRRAATSRQVFEPGIFELERTVIWVEASFVCSSLDVVDRTLGNTSFFVDLSRGLSYEWRIQRDDQGSSR